MLATTLLTLCERTIKVGLVRSKADFCRIFLARNERYLELIKESGAWVPRHPCERLVQHLELVVSKSPDFLRPDVQDLLDEARQGIDVARLFRR